MAGAAALVVTTPDMMLHELLREEPDRATERMSEALRQRWQAQLGPGRLARRLAWAAEGSSGPSTAPAHGEALLAAALENPEAPVLSGGLDPAAPIPFEEVLLPLLVAARSELEREAGAALRLFTPSALASLERGLLVLLSHLALPVLGSEFSLRRALAGRLPWLERPGSTDDYRSFVTAMRSGELGLLLREYPGLARLLAIAARGWVTAHGRLMVRLGRDWPDLRASFGFSDGECRVEGIATSCSDPHDGGQSVAILHLTGARPLVYKPRPLDMDDGLRELLGWANSAGFPWPFREVGLLPRQGYGWMEHVAAAPCDDEAAVTRFYVRSGALFCLWWLLQGTDIHHENLIANGEQPVIVDAETLLHPRPFPGVARGLGPGAGRGDDAEGDFARALRESGFLPSGMAVDLSCWGTGGGLDTPFLVTRCRAVNSDAMAVCHEPFHVAPRPNLPVLHGRSVPAAPHAEAIIDGFTAMFRLVLRERAGFLAVLDRFAGRGGRFVARATNVYGLLLGASLLPEWLREGPARGVLYEQLRRAAVEETHRPACWPLLDAELAALEQLDVPRFTSRCDLPSPCWPTPLDEARARVVSASEDALERHVAALRRALSRLVGETPCPEAT
ncbi:hypothetical protein CYFUS_003085 [Cystobacter fuscus]|uniref:Lantibiotic biosynthesis protein dehydration domain-containing protein n=1 Tax=Cystobacter fuscus TaxID=43 RepID=A0A250J2A5_9BACT|nr:type 2 lanthipeptide synthetase LanM [Cystobacter fuscus]ATB37660.1 hypothetical protein CYFUS_003085 [Cystobacter fuscus]